MWPESAGAEIPSDCASHVAFAHVLHWLAVERQDQVAAVQPAERRPPANGDRLDEDSVRRRHRRIFPITL